MSPRTARYTGRDCDSTERGGPPTSDPPRILAPLASRPVEENAQGKDIRRPLVIKRNYPPGGCGEAIPYQVRTGVTFGGAKESVSSAKLAADDADPEIGDGPASTDRLWNSSCWSLAAARARSGRHRSVGQR